MRSIIDEIALAEEQADQIRQEAVSAARELLAASRVGAEEIYAHTEEEERDKMREAIAKAEEEGRQQAETILQELSNAADVQCEAARLKLEEAVSYLLQKVQEIA